MVPVKSSSIAAVGYNAPQKRMSVKFNSGSTYHYAGVEPDQHSALVTASSVGKHFHANVLGKFKATKA
jgi:hypothetical protein